MIGSRKAPGRSCRVLSNGRMVQMSRTRIGALVAPSGTLSLLYTPPQLLYPTPNCSRQNGGKRADGVIFDPDFGYDITSRSLFHFLYRCPQLTHRRKTMISPYAIIFSSIPAILLLSIPYVMACISRIREMHTAKPCDRLLCLPDRACYGESVTKQNVGNQISHTSLAVRSMRTRGWRWRKC